MHQLLSALGSILTGTWEMFLLLDPLQRGRSLKNSPEQLTRHGDLRHLKGDAPGVGNRLRADLHPILPKRPQQPVFHR